jgi:hypothetical protein
VSELNLDDGDPSGRLDGDKIGVAISDRHLATHDGQAWRTGER